MSKRIVSSACAAAVLSFAVATAQTTTDQSRRQYPTTGSTQGTTRTQTQSTPRTPTNRGARAEAQQVVISGCVARGTAANQAGQYLLNNAVMANIATGQIGAAGSVDVNGNVNGGFVETTGTIAGGVTQTPGTENDQTPASERAATSGAVGTSGHEADNQTRRETGATGGRTSGTTAASADAHASANPSSYMLVPGRTDLSMWVGQHVEVTGRVVSNAGGNRTTGTTGTTASAQSANAMARLQVISVRPIPGNCL